MNRLNRLRSLAVLLPFGALALFMPPYILLFDNPVTLVGIPLLPLAIFALWLIGIVLTGLVARALDRASAVDIGQDDGAIEDAPDRPSADTDLEP